MPSSIRPVRSRSFRNRPLESLEARSLLSNVPGADVPWTGDDPTTIQVTTFDGGGFPGSSDDFGGSGSFGFDPPPDLDASPVEMTTQPGNSSASASSPDRIVVTFSHPLNSFDLGLFSNDVRLDRVNADGSTTPWFDPANTPPQIADNNGGLDFTFSELAIPLDSPLPDGEYRLVLVAGSGLSMSISAGRWDPFSDYVISTFTIGAAAPGGGSDGGGGTTTPEPDPLAAEYTAVAPGSQVQSVVDLGVLPTAGPVQPGSLIPTPAGPSVNLYRFQVAEGHHWRLGIAARIQDGAAGFQTILSLFRISADGGLQPVSLSDPAAGLVDQSSNGLSYAGLGAGTYCLAVAGMFDPNADAATEGRYQLELETTSADQPAEVVDFQLNRVNPGDAAPAGLTIQFSTAVALDGFDGRTAAPPLEVVDSQGRLWGVLPLGYNHDRNALTLVFGERLPAGTYSLRIGSQNGLTDLAGWAPTAPGLPAGTLAVWTVAAESTPPAANDLGIVWPLSTTGVGRTSRLADAASDSFQFAVVAPGLYKLQTDRRDGAAQVRIVSAAGVVLLDALVAPQIGSYHLFLPIGRYTIQWTGTSVSTADVFWTLNNSSINWESLLNNGVGQWSSLNLGYNPVVANPSTSTTGPTSSTSTAAGGVGSVASAAVLDARAAGPAQPLALAPLPYAPVGAPSAATQSIAAVGPAVNANATAVALNSTGLIDGIRYVRSSLGMTTDEDATAIPSPSGEEAAADPAHAAPRPERSAVWNDPLATTDDARAADEAALSSLDWVLGLGRDLQEWLKAAGLGGDVAPGALETAADPAMLAELGLGGEEVKFDGSGRGRAEQAAFGFPLGLIVTTAIVYRAKDPIRRWWKRGSRRLAYAGLAPTPLSAGRAPVGGNPAVPQHGRAPGAVKRPHFLDRLRTPAAGSARRPHRRESAGSR